MANLTIVFVSQIVTEEIKCEKFIDFRILYSEVQTRMLRSNRNLPLSMPLQYALIHKTHAISSSYCMGF
jgi:hypothetical protein